MEYSDELHDKIWAAQGWRELVEGCGAEIIETGRNEGGAPGQSDIGYWVAVGDPDNFRAALRAHIVAAGHCGA